MSDHFGALCIKGLRVIEVNSVTWICTTLEAEFGNDPLTDFFAVYNKTCQDVFLETPFSVIIAHS